MPLVLNFFSSPDDLDDVCQYGGIELRGFNKPPGKEQSGHRTVRETQGSHAS